MHGKTTCSATLLLIALLSIAHALQASTLPNGLSLTDFRLETDKPALVGGQVRIQFTLKNLHQEPILFEEPGLFVAARCDDRNLDFGHQQGVRELRGGETVTVKAARRLDAAGPWRFWPGFKIGGHWGPFGWMEKRVDVFASKAEAMEADRPLEVAQILAGAARYDNRTVTVSGVAFIVRKKRDRNKRPWNLISIVDTKDNKKVMNVFALGHAPIVNGDKIKVTGIFKVKSLRGRYHFDNEIDATKGRIEKIE